ncbi:hypothetical protein ACIOEZ_34635, partial [Streptomyces sp. NPDC087866]|uniref:hypothetical protein n=1 Tax=Streptomyces sp. NPDC087866 TaxID=3365815 RepID=UPI0037FD8C1C
AGVWGGMTAGERHQVLQDRGQEVGVLPVDLWPDEPDPEAVDAYLTGKRSDVADIDRLAAICAAVDAGMAFRDIDRLHGIALRSTSKFMGKMREAFAKDGRRFPLSDQWASNVRTFTNEQVREIRERAAAGGRSAKELAAEYGVHPKTMGSMLTGVSYPEAGGPLRAGRPRRSSVVSELCAQDMEVAA